GNVQIGGKIGGVARGRVACDRIQAHDFLVVLSRNGRIDRGRIVDVELKIDADTLEKVVVERDEANFDRDLQILIAPQLFQELDDFFVDFLRLADDEAQVVAELGDRTGTTNLVPG